MDAYEVKAIQIENSAHMLSFYDLSDVGSFPLPKCIRLKIDVPPRSGCMLELTSSRFGGSRISFTYTRISPKKNRLDLNASLRCSSCVHNERKIIVEDIQGYVKTTGFCKVSLKACGRSLGNSWKKNNPIQSVCSVDKSNNILFVHTH